MSTADNRRAIILASMREEICPGCDTPPANRACHHCEMIMVYRDAVCAWRSTAWLKIYNAMPQTNALRDLDGLPSLPCLEYDFTIPRRHEMHAGGWMPSAWGEVHCPMMDESVNPADPGALLALHFVIMGEPVPDGVCPSLHVLDTWASRAIALAAEVATPSPESVTEAWR